MEIVADKKTYALFSNAQAVVLAAKLEHKGAKVFRFAPPVVRQIISNEISKIVKNDLRDFDWIIFPDVFAVDSFVRILEENEVDLFELDALQIVALGEAVSDRLRFVQLHADIIPAFTDAESVFSTILQYLEADDLSALNFMMPKASQTTIDLTKILSESGASVLELAVSEVELMTNQRAKITALIAGGAIDEFIFTSPEDVFSLKHFLVTDDLSKILDGISTSGTNEIAIQALRENNLRPHFLKIK